MKKASKMLVFAMLSCFCSQFSFASVLSVVKYERAGRYYLVVQTTADGGVQADFFGGIIRKPATTPKPTFAGMSVQQLEGGRWLIEAGSENELMELFARLRKEGQF